MLPGFELGAPASEPENIPMCQRDSIINDDKRLSILNIYDNLHSKLKKP